MDPIRTSPRRGLARLVVALAALAAALTVGAAGAQTASADGFECRGSAIRVDALVATLGLDAEPTVANAPGAPCAAQENTLLTLPNALSGVVRAGVSEASTTAGAGAVTARGAIKDAVLLQLLGGGIGVGAVEATAGYQCVAGAPVARAGGQIVGLTLFGRAIANTSDPLTLDLAVDLRLPLVPVIRLGSIALNETRTTATSVTRTALRVSVAPSIDGLGLLGPVLDGLLGSLLGADVVLGEARAALVGNPCPPVAPPPGRVPEPPVDPALRAPVVDDGPPARTPLTDATLRYHSTDANVTLECRLDGRPWAACNGRSDYRDLALGQHCFEVRARRGDGVGPTTRYCWTVVALPTGCVASYRHGYFVNAGNAALGRRQVVFHATSRDGRLLLTTRSARGVLKRVEYSLNGTRVATGARHEIPFAQLDRGARQSLRVTVTGNGRRGTITRSFRYVNYVALDCEGREVVDGIAPRTVTVGGQRVRIRPQVPNEIRGTAKLRFFVQPARRHSLRAVAFALDGRALRNHLRSAVLTAPQLKAGGTQTLTIRLAPRVGKPKTVRIAFTTNRT